MTAVVPPSPPTQPPAPPAPQAAVVVPDPPVPLTRLSPGDRLDGIVLARDAKGQAQIQTSLGTLAVQTNAPLPRGAAVVLVVQSLGSQVQLQIVSVDGQPLAAALRLPVPGIPAPSAALPAAAGAPASAASGAAAATSTAGTAPAAVAAGGTDTATLLRPAQGPPAGTAARAAPGGHGAAAFAAAKAGFPAPAGPSAATVRASAPGAAHVPAAAAGSLPAGAQGVSGSAPAAAQGGLVAGTRMTVSILAVQPAAPAAAFRAPAAGLALGQTLTGTVAGMTVSNQPMVHTPAGVLAFATRTLLPQGGTVTFQVTDEPVPPPAPETAPLRAAPGGWVFSRDWPALDEALMALNDANAVLAQHLVNAIIPRPDANLAANILFFLAALRGGDIRGWLGDRAGRLLQRVRPDVMARLKDEFGGLARLAEDPGRGDWRIALIPFHNGAQIERIRLFLRRHGEDGEGGTGGRRGTRFVIDVELERFGRLQLDGLVRARNRRLDLIVRTGSPLPPRMHDDIRRIFRDATELTGIKGAVAFQAAPPGFVEILRQGATEDHVGLVV
ncbi:MAG: hypothetical protein ACE5FR_10225 [Rhodospirillales bacterium]